MKEMVYNIERTFEILAQGLYRDIPYWVISRGTHPCAYIEASCFNDFLGKDTQEWQRCDDVKIECHGGVTYDADYLWNIWDASSEDFRPNCKRFIGWDYAHGVDYSTFLPELNGKKWTTEEIVWEVKEVIDSLITSVAGAKELKEEKAEREQYEKLKAKFEEEGK